jgi:hypothetical protein
MPGTRPAPVSFVSSTAPDVSCAWCGGSIEWSEQAFPIYFAATGLQSALGGAIQVKMQGIDRTLSLLVPPNQPSSLRNALEVVAVCCSSECQDQLKQTWSSLELKTLARS